MLHISKTPLSIAIDGNEANVTHRVGSNTYAFEVLTALEKLTASEKFTGDNEQVKVTVLLSQPPVGDLPRTRKLWHYKILKPSPLWTQWALPIHLYLHRHAYDVFFTPGHYAPRVCPLPYISSVMDLAFLEYPEQFLKKDLFQLKSWTRASVKKAKKVIAISEFTKSEIIRKYGRKAEDIVVAYPAVSYQTVVQTTAGRSNITPTTVSAAAPDTKHPTRIKEKDRLAVLKKFHIKQPFLLFVGTLQPRKNITRLVEAFEQLHYQAHQTNDSTQKKNKTRSHILDYKDIQLVLAGKQGWLSDAIMARIDASPLRQKIIITGFITEKEKQALYESCVCCVLVGLYEGFGIPALEALLSGSTPLVSETSSLPEVVGEAGILVDPRSSEHIAQGLRRVLSLSAKERAALLKKGREQVKKFSWEHSARIILNTLFEVAQRR